MRRGGDAILLTGLDLPFLTGELVLFSRMPCNNLWTWSGLFDVCVSAPRVQGEPTGGRLRALMMDFVDDVYSGNVEKGGEVPIWSECMGVKLGVDSGLLLDEEEGEEEEEEEEEKVRMGMGSDGIRTLEVGN